VRRVNHLNLTLLPKISMKLGQFGHEMSLNIAIDKTQHTEVGFRSGVANELKVSRTGEQNGPLANNLS
jgi:hypothetical protein